MNENQNGWFTQGDLGGDTPSQQNSLSGITSAPPQETAPRQAYDQQNYVRQGQQAVPNQQSYARQGQPMPNQQNYARQGQPMTNQQNYARQGQPMPNQQAYAPNQGYAPNQPSYAQPNRPAYVPQQPEPKAKKKAKRSGKKGGIIAAIVILLAVMIGGGAYLFLADQTCTVTFDLDGGELISGSLEQEVEKGESAKAPKTEREGYDFEGWDEEFDEVNKDITVTAQWEEISEFTVTFDANGGEIVSGEAEQTVSKGESASAPEVAREGYSFDGWDGDYASITEDTEVKAQWTEVVTHTVTFDANGGEIVSGESVQTVADGEAAEAPTAEREGYTFTGWDADFSAVTEDLTAAAQWERYKPTAEELYQQIQPSVVEIHVYDASDTYTALGSGFFIDDEGTLATNYHVIEDSCRAVVITSDGDELDVAQVLGYDKDMDLALLKVENYESKPLTISDEPAVTGETVYTLGSSLGLTGTFSDGIVSTASQVVDGVECIQITAPISHGNSGGPLVNVYGDVLGINSMSLADGQNLNFAINVHLLDELDTSSPVTMEQFYEDTADASSSSDAGDAETYTENEPNDGYSTADTLHNGSYMSAYCDTEDADVFTFTLTEISEVLIMVAPEYTVDDEYIVAGITNEDGNVLEEGILDSTEYEGNSFHAVDVTLEAGTYYLIVGIPDDVGYPYTYGPDYIIYIQW